MQMIPLLGISLCLQHDMIDRFLLLLWHSNRVPSVMTFIISINPEIYNTLT